MRRRRDPWGAAHSLALRGAANLGSRFGERWPHSGHQRGASRRAPGGSLSGLPAGGRAAGCLLRCRFKTFLARGAGQQQLGQPHFADFLFLFAVTLASRAFAIPARAEGKSTAVPNAGGIHKRGYCGSVRGSEREALKGLFLMEPGRKEAPPHGCTWSGAVAPTSVPDACEDERRKGGGA